MKHTRPDFVTIQGELLLAYWSKPNQAVAVHPEHVRDFLIRHEIDPDDFFPETLTPLSEWTNR